MAECVVLEKCHPLYLSQKTRRKLGRCSFGAGGLLQDLIEEPDIAEYGSRDVVYMLMEGHKVIGWGLKYKREFMLHVYKKYRRKGWGTVLYKEALKDFGKRKPTVYAGHSEEATNFWKANKRRGC